MLATAAVSPLGRPLGAPAFQPARRRPGSMPGRRRPGCDQGTFAAGRAAAHPRGAPPAPQAAVTDVLIRHVLPSVAGNTPGGVDHKSGHVARRRPLAPRGQLGPGGRASAPVRGCSCRGSASACLFAALPPGVAHWRQSRRSRCRERGPAPTNQQTADTKGQQPARRRRRHRL
jgi:hypothetical protein